MSEVAEMLADILDDLDGFNSLSMEAANKMTSVKKKLKKVINTLYKEEADAEIRGIDGQPEGLDVGDEVWPD
jgi:hypothetical protein